MLQKIIKSLRSCSDLKAWSIRHIKVEGAQQYDLRDAVESRRSVRDERYVVNVLRETASGDGAPSCGESSVTILPGGDIESALDRASLMAGLVHNQPYDFAEPASLPDVSVVDEPLKTAPSIAAEQALSELKMVASAHPQVSLTAAECFADVEMVHLVNSRGIDATQESTMLQMEWVFIAGEGEEGVETFASLKRRRAADLNLEMEAGRRARQTADLLIAVPPTSFRGAVVMRDSTLAEVMNSGVIQTLSSAGFKYTGETQWEIGKSAFRGQVKGDPLNVWANRRLPYGVGSSCFDMEGLPAQRVELIRNGKLVAFWASQRFAQYLGMPATGQFGDIELAPGSKPTAELLREDHVEIVDFSWFNPNPISGDFSCEIRLGYVVEGGERKPFKGGMLVGNFLDALADVRWSSETGFYGNYLGPTTARFNELVVAGDG